MLHFSQYVCERVGNHFSPHSPPYIELSFSSSLCWYTYSPQTTQIQALEEGSARTCVGATPTREMRVKGWKPSLPVRILLLQGLVYLDEGERIQTLSKVISKHSP